jgi:hypothetical protein
MICALLDFERVFFLDNEKEPSIFRCKMPNLPSDVPSMMGFELLQAQVVSEKRWADYVGGFLFLLNTAENYHNNTLTNEIFLAYMESRSWVWFPKVEGGSVSGVNTGQVGIQTYRSRSDTKVKVYISTKQDYLYFQFKNKINEVSHINYNDINKAKLIVRLTFDTRQNEYQPKRIML